MPSEYSYVHGQPGYWRIRFDDWNGWEAPHIHAMQGDRELQVYTQTLQIKNQTGRFSSAEIDEIINIAKSYSSNYCLSLNENMFESSNINELKNLKETIISMVDTKKYVK